NVLGKLAPPTRGSGICLEVGLKVDAAIALWHWQISRKQVIQRRDVGRPLNRGVSAQGENSTPRTADVAEKQLNDGSGTNVLHADRMLRPTDGVTKRRSAFASRVGAQQFRHAMKEPSRHAAHRLDDLRRISREMPFQDLQHTARMLKRRIAIGRELPGLIV